MLPLSSIAASAVAGGLRASTVQVSSGQRGAGSGIIWRSDGVVVTNAHVVRGRGAQVTLDDGRSFDAVTALRDERCDLAVLLPELAGSDVDGLALRVPQIRDPRTLRVGEIVLALGAPWGIPGCLALGVVHAAHEPVRRGGREAEAEIVRADVRLAPGNSGGPLADAAGRIVGVNAMIVGGLGVAISTRTVARLLRDLDARRSPRAA
jgi:serine protease Do